ncbi:DUF1439 domain-containing protein [Pseudoxanthomonas suwonensis]|uniref:DUF1439 domain-containing protein n=1 Tax=Pseudoxanthomonas suwonensis TaxID=314722 RepID=UPI0004B87984|nr:DUF1439 domain-containing protein [Pseudoxanthomonas suwonensis]
MRSRPSLPWLLCACLALAGALPTAAAPQVDGRRVSVGAEDARLFLEGRFPVTRDALGGLVEVTASRPQLEIPPGSRMRLSLDLALATMGGAPVPMGRADLSSALRYDAARQAFFLDQPRVEAFHPATGGEGLDAKTQALLNAWLADYAASEPVYRIDPAIAALLGGMQVESAGIEDGRLVVTFDREVGMAAPAP